MRVQISQISLTMNRFNTYIYPGVCVGVVRFGSNLSTLLPEKPTIDSKGLNYLPFLPLRDTPLEGR